MTKQEPATRLQRWLRALGLHRRELRSWALYDWGNSAFATTIMAAVLPVYYAQVAAADLPSNVATAYWGYTAAAGMLVIAFAAPALGAMADHLGAKKRFLAGFVAMGVLATACLYLVGRGDWILASILYVVGNIGFTGSIVFSDSLLPHIAREDEIDRVSTAGFAVGYIGGGVLLLVNLLMIQMPERFGFADAGEATRWSFITVAVWWALFTIPLLRDVAEPPSEPREAGESVGAIFANSLRRLRTTFAEIRQYRQLFTFLVAFWFYGDGIGTIIRMAVIYGAEIGIGQGSLMGALLLVQFVGIPATFAFGSLAGRIGARNGIYLALVVYSGVSIFGYFMTAAWQFWTLAIAVGLVQGGSQALSRSLYASMVPRAKSSEFFSFFSVFEKFAGIMGPLIFGLVGQITGTSRLGILALIVFFVGGIVILSRVDIEEGRRVARQADNESGLASDGLKTAH